MGRNQKNPFLMPFIAALAFVFCGFMADKSLAAVTGECVNCHTMHNSQGGIDVDADGPNRVLLKTDCVGCHSAADGVTWKDAVTGAPIVNNSAPPSFGQDNQGLAGGNFYWLVAGDHSMGHNVLTLPGVTGDTVSVNGAYPPLSDFGSSDTNDCGRCHGANGAAAWLMDCTSCHVPKHHADDHPGGVYTNVVGESGGYYRFLGNHAENKCAPPGNSTAWHTNFTVKGIEDQNWEQNPSSTAHNEYSGVDMATLPGWGDPAQSGASTSISRWCAGCHDNAHSAGGGTGLSSPWLRHPTDFALPNSSGKEYQYYTTYNPQAPVARPDIDSLGGSSAVVTPGVDMVQCLSCHRPHGSPYPDMLRWDYNGMMAGGGGDVGQGCFVCHTTKD